jgi:hypothetical protein
MVKYDIYDKRGAFLATITVAGWSEAADAKARDHGRPVFEVIPRRNKE